MASSEHYASNSALEAPALQLLLNSANVPLRYSITRASSYSGAYHPNNILHNRPHDMYSRWSGSSSHAQPALPSSSALHGLTSSSSSASPSASSPSNLSSSVSGSSSTRKPGPPGSSIPSAVIGNSSGQHSPKQYIILKLEKPSIVRTITFGKYHKPHPCNLRDFKIYGSLSLDSLLPAQPPGARPPATKRLVRGGLRNDSTPETFELRWLEDAGAGSGSGSGSLADSNIATGEGELDRRGLTAALVAHGNAIPFALRYIKIVPLAAHTPNYNFSVWHVALSGVSTTLLVSRVMREYDEYRESSTIRLILKHLREQGHHTAFSALLQSSRLAPSSLTESTAALASRQPVNPTTRPFEHPLLTQLFDALVRTGSWDEVEACLDRAAYGDIASAPSTPASPPPRVQSPSQNLAGSAVWSSASQQSMFSSYITKQMPKAHWLQIQPQSQHVPQRDSSGQAPALMPSGRGGHSMVFDSDKGVAYLFGGWDGKQDLSDLWAFHVHENRWRLISPDVRQQGGPSPRSCHKMCLDEKSGCIYLLGRYTDYDGSGRESGAGAAAATVASPSPSPSSSSAARSTRASFLPQAPLSTNIASRDVAMNVADASSQTGISDSTLAPVSAAPNRANRHGEPGSPASGAAGAGADSESQGRTQLEGSPAVSPRPVSRTNSGQRTSGRGLPLASPPGRESDFYRFSTRSERWERLSADTYADGGPKLIYDHGLVADPQSQMLYVFGGRVADPDPAKFEFSGMWRYDIIQRTWTFLFDDNTSTGGKILSRSGHSMLLDPGKPSFTGMSPSHSRQIWILGGQRGAAATYLADMYTYNLATGAVREVSRNTGQQGPESGFTQRATLDAAAREISLFVGLIGSNNERKRSAFWIYSISRGTWRKVYQYETGSTGADTLGLSEGMGNDFGAMELDTGPVSVAERGLEEDLDGECEGDEEEVPESGPLQALPSYSDGDDDEDMAVEAASQNWTTYAGSGSIQQDFGTGPDVDNPTLGPRMRLNRALTRSGKLGASSEPRPRYAAQMVYDERRKVYYLHGGNPEDAHNKAMRLDDLWQLTLLRPTCGEILRRAKFKVRRQRFLEMVRLISSRTAGGGLESSVSSLGASDAASLGLEALVYLQSEVGAVVDHSNEAESKVFRKLMARLLSARSAAAGTSSDDTPVVSVSSPPSGVGVDMDQDRDRDREGEALDRVLLSGKRKLEGDEDDVSSLGDSEMLSASQTLPQRVSKRAVQVKVMDDEGRPTSLYAERNQLFRGLLEYFNTELIEPRAELSECIESALGS